jgi:hypothetical protein
MLVTLAFTAIMLIAWAGRAINAGALTSYHANVEFTAATTNDPPGTLDPGYTKDVADCLALIAADDRVQISLQNGYPSYTCTFTVDILNSGRLPVKLDPLDINAPTEVLTVTPLEDHTGLLLEAGRTDRERFSVHVEQPASQGASYFFEIRKTFRLHATGTIGFWKNWNRHNTFTKAEIEGWLVQINNASSWFGPTTAQGMVTLINQGSGNGATARSRFLAQCMATRLNERSGIFEAGDPHNVTSADPGNYLGLATPSNATLAQIIAAIESKYGTSPTNAQYLVMKEVCDRLNNLGI